MPRRSPARHFTTWVAIGSILALFGPSRAWAQDQTEAREAEARKECAAGRYRRGVEILAELFVQTTEPIYVYNQGRCYEENGQLEQAITRFREYQNKLRASPGSAGEIAEVEARIKGLEERAKPRTTQPTPPGLRFNPGPPAAPETPVYHRAWFWVAVGVVAAGSVAAVLLAKRPREGGPPACPDCNLSFTGVPTR
jgi:hypothetical protein